MAVTLPPATANTAAILLGTLNPVDVLVTLKARGLATGDHGEAADVADVAVWLDEVRAKLQHKRSTKEPS